MTDAGYVVGGYAVTAGAVTAYVARLWCRSRALARSASAPPDDVPVDRR